MSTELPEEVTLDEAIANACRLLRAAEFQTDRQLMERLEKLADSWLGVAGILVQMKFTS